MGSNTAERKGLSSDDSHRKLRLTMKQFLLAFFCLSLFSACDTVRYMAADRTDREQREKLEMEREAWQLKNFELQYLSGQIDRDAYNRARRSHGLAPIE